MQQKIEILQTKDYSKFKLLKGNREIKEKHILKLMESITAENCVSPIQVNEHMAIIDGQHRFNAHMRLKLPIYYYIVKGANLTTVQKLNSHAENWDNKDFLTSWIAKGLQDYSVYKEFADKYRFTHKINLMLLMGTNGYLQTDAEDFDNGKFKIKDLAKAMEMADKLMQIEQYYKGFKRRSFAAAMVRCMRTKGFDFKRFLEKLRYQSTKLVDCSNETQYLEILEKIYNFMNKTKDKLVLRKL